VKKSLRLICLAFVALVIGAGLKLMYTFPVNTQPYVEKKYAGWNGVLQAWICTNWEPGGSFISWLNGQAAAFEKSHEGVYLEFTPITVETLNALSDGGIRKPDLLFFSPGTLTNPSLLAPLKFDDAIRNDLQGYGNGCALPVAMGGYIWVYNTALCETAPIYPDEVTVLRLPTDSKGYSYSAALLGLLSTLPGNDAPQPPVPDSGIDLGLSASAAETSLHSDSALEQFISGELPCIPVSSSDLKWLVRLRDGGKGPDWKAYASGEIACTDQLFMAGIPAQHAGSERGQLSEEFLRLLIDDESQSKLADIGAHGVTGEKIYSGFSVYAELDALLNSRLLWLPACFSEYSAANPEAIVRGFLNKDFPAKKALGLLGFEGM